jgi:tripartite-type tricarboxylate transporter receptor subunit TctC
MKRFFAIVACVVLGGLATASAQTFPSRPVTIVVPFAAGGPTDVLARVLGQRMATTLGQSVVIENVTGAGGSIGVGRVVRSPADGYTLSIGQLGTHALNGAIYALPYDLLTDLEPIALLASNPQLIVTKKAMPAKDLRELIAWLKANQDKTIVGTAGAGTPAHVSGVYLQNQLGSKFQFVPYRGAGPAMQDLIAGNIDLYFDQASNSIAHVRNGSIKAYAVTSKTRLPSAPDIPTADEAGLPGFNIAVWHGLWAPKGTPKDVIEKVNAAVREALADPATRLKLSELGQDIPAPEQQTPPGLAAFQKAEIDKWWPIVRAANITAQ